MLTFQFILVIILLYNYLNSGNLEVIIMLKNYKYCDKDCNSKLAIIIAAIATFTAVAATVTALLVVREKKKKKEEQELDEYLDCSIQ